MNWEREVEFSFLISDYNSGRLQCRAVGSAPKNRTCGENRNFDQLGISCAGGIGKLVVNAVRRIALKHIITHSVAIRQQRARDRTVCAAEGSLGGIQSVG